MNPVVLLDPRNKALFASFYVEGLRKMFGSKSLRYSMLPFGELDRAKDFSYDHYMCFIVAGGGIKEKLS